MSEVDYLIRELEQRRNDINLEIRRIKAQFSESNYQTPEHVKDRMRRLEDHRKWLNRSIEKLIYQSGDSLSGRRSFSTH
jgi:hypothetical protein